MRHCLQYSAIGLPAEFSEHLHHQHDHIARAKAHIAGIVSDVTASLGGSGSEEEKRESKGVAAAAISKKFMVSAAAVDESLVF